MEITKYFSNAPEDLNLKNAVDELSLLKVYAFNSYFNADTSYTGDVNDGCTYRRDKDAGIDGVYINQNLGDDAIECLHSYYLGNNPFALKTVFNWIDKICAELTDINGGKFLGNQEAGNLLNRYLFEFEIKKVIIRIVTDYLPDDKTKYEIKKKIENHDVSISGLEVSATIDFGDDVASTIDSNQAPYDYVEKGKLIIDEPNNFLKYKDHSVVCNISAKSLKKLWDSEGKKGLLAMNLRYYIKSINIDSKIEDSIQNDNENFWYLNNGIIIVCDDYKIIGNELRLNHFSIVNGGQTTRMIGTVPFDNDFFISCKVVKNVFETSNEKNTFISKVAEASNTQKPIKAKDIIANRIEQRNLKTMMSENHVFIEIKRGEKCDPNLYAEPWQKTKNNELAQDLFAFVYMQPGPARNSISSILSSNDKYNTIFKNHDYSFAFLKDILFLEKLYKEYQKKVKKDYEKDPSLSVKNGLVIQGLHYCLAVIGYCLKLNYNKEFRNDIYKYRNDKTKYELFSSELAFMHPFIDSNTTYKQFKASAFELFDFVFGQFIIPQFNLAKINNPATVYSNFLKANTGFDLIRQMINGVTFDSKQNYLIDGVAKFFVKIDQKTENDNIDRYADYCQKNKKIQAKNFSGFELSPQDTALRNDLMIYRLNYSTAKSISENKIFSDKAIDKILIAKPVNKEELGKLIPATTCAYCGDDILKIIEKYL